MLQIKLLLWDLCGVYFIWKPVVPTADEVEKPQISTKGNF